MVFNLVTAIVSTITSTLTGYLLYRENCRRDKNPNETVSIQPDLIHSYKHIANILLNYRISSGFFTNVHMHTNYILHQLHAASINLKLRHNTYLTANKQVNKIYPTFMYSFIYWKYKAQGKK